MEIKSLSIQVSVGLGLEIRPAKLKKSCEWQWRVFDFSNIIERLRDKTQVSVCVICVNKNKRNCDFYVRFCDEDLTRKNLCFSEERLISSRNLTLKLNYTVKLSVSVATGPLLVVSVQQITKFFSREILSCFSKLSVKSMVLIDKIEKWFPVIFFQQDKLFNTENWLDEKYFY